MFKLCDTVLARFMQIIQEAMLTGIDATDLMRAIQLEKSSEDDSVLVLTQAYKDSVAKEYEKLLKFADEQKSN